MGQPADTKNDFLRAANRLHHLSLRYVGALAEVAKGQPVGALPAGYPGISEMRDLIDLILYCRAECNVLTAVLLQMNPPAISLPDLQKMMAEEYEKLAQEKAEQLGCEVFDGGLVFKVPGAQN